MLALRLAGLLAISVWFGGLLMLGAVVAPAVFDVTGSLPDGRALGGGIAGEIFRRFHLVSYACGAVILGALALRAVLGPRPRWFGLRVGLTSGTLALALYSGLVVSGRIESLRQEIGAAPSSLREDDPRRIGFGRLHAQSTALYLAALIGTLVLLVAERQE